MIKGKLIGIIFILGNITCNAATNNFWHEYYSGCLSASNMNICFQDLKSILLKNGKHNIIIYPQDQITNRRIDFTSESYHFIGNFRSAGAQSGVIQIYTGKINYEFRSAKNNRYTLFPGRRQNYKEALLLAKQHFCTNLYPYVQKYINIQTTIITNIIIFKTNKKPMLIAPNKKKNETIK